MTIKIIAENLIPNSLWHEDVLHLPAFFITSYIETLKKYGLYENAQSTNKDPNIHGGCSEEETQKHFTYRFAVSAGRPEAVLIAKGENLAKISNALITSLSSGEVFILDIPAGTGAGALSLICTIAELRLKKIIPSLPLTINLFAADCSESGLAIYQSQIHLLKTYFDEAAITTTIDLMIWDATRGDSTADLLRRIDPIASGSDESIVCISNFSGALIDAGLLDRFTPCLEQILAWLNHYRTTLVWIEPCSNDSKKLSTRIIKFITDRIPWFTSSLSIEPEKRINYSMRDPINNNIFKSGVQVQRFER